MPLCDTLSPVGRLWVGGPCALWLQVLMLAHLPLQAGHVTLPGAQ